MPNIVQIKKSFNYLNLLYLPRDRMLNFTNMKWFDGLVGHGICLTRRTSPVRSWVESIFLIFKH